MVSQLALLANLFCWVSRQLGVGKNCKLTLSDLSESPIDVGFNIQKIGFSPKRLCRVSENSQLTRIIESPSHDLLTALPAAKQSCFSTSHLVTKCDPSANRLPWLSRNGQKCSRRRRQCHPQLD